MRICDFTKKVIHCGWVLNDSTYISSSEIATEEVKKLGYKNIDEAYKDNVIYWTEFNLTIDDKAEWGFSKNLDNEDIAIWEKIKEIYPNKKLLPDDIFLIIEAFKAGILFNS